MLINSRGYLITATAKSWSGENHSSLQLTHSLKPTSQQKTLLSQSINAF